MYKLVGVWYVVERVSNVLVNAFCVHTAWFIINLDNYNGCDTLDP